MYAMVLTSEPFQHTMTQVINRRPGECGKLAKCAQNTVLNRQASQ